MNLNEMPKDGPYYAVYVDGLFIHHENTFRKTTNLNSAFFLTDENQAQRLAKLSKGTPIKITSELRENGFFSKWVEWEFLPHVDVGDVDPKEFRKPKKKREGSYWPDRVQDPNKRVIINGKSYPVIK